jgi:kynurenine formamidase
MTMTPAGAAVDHAREPWLAAGPAFSADCFMAPTHSGTHIDCLNHAVANGRIWGGIEAERALGSRFWRECGAEHLPPVVMRGVLADVAPGEVLAPGTEVGPSELEAALAREGVRIARDDVVLIRTGWMRNWPNDRYLGLQPGLTRAGAEFLVGQGAALIGADNAALEVIPSLELARGFPVHQFLLVEEGIQIMENVVLDELAKDRVFSFLFIGLPLKLRGASASPVRPIAIPLPAE